MNPTLKIRAYQPGSAIWVSTKGYHIMAAGVSGRDRLQPVAEEILAKTVKLIMTTKQHNE